MLGFVIDGNILGSVKLIRGHIIQERARVALVDDWATEQSLGSHRYLYHTRHQQQGRKSTVTILHLFLPIS
jgi:hypothetical protein